MKSSIVNVDFFLNETVELLEFFIQWAPFEIKSLFSLVNLSSFDILTVLYKISYQRHCYSL